MMTGEPVRIDIRDEADLVVLRKRCRELLQQLGFRPVAQTKLVTAASELGRNALVHGGGGYALLAQVSNGGHRGLKMTFVDEGPGIADLDQAMTDGYTSGGGLGLGLGASRRLANEFRIETAPGQGTKVEIIGWS